MSIITIDGSIEVQDENGQTHTIHGSSFSIDHVSTDSDRPMGSEQIYEATYEDDDVAVTVTISEYPEETYETHEVSVDAGTLVSDNLSVSIHGQAE